ncbi:unnamed protein product [Malassezia sympodialis ATCC 42132]|uniref:uncharacterized protein n=1 Tax=Malassezia sympodialis (strain ATCC 42132) TaxID=1230383 RepID=UPI0002C28C67|nr:uncharacterized protein MSY001_0291 [Malassezia sympodialis ATCC 42132]CCU97585.1 unnamed protein product [Malassezia sympodialis ATCC 42132]|eukprot:XP_018738933.1 uncharacterized protein MSY001_0291 [Malassezia sympodialis ATCC 42132]
MDAISFVLGVRGAQLRSADLTDLVYSSSTLQGDTAGSEEIEEPQRASVTAVLEEGRGTEHRFQRVITSTGSTEYRYNGRVTTQASYNNKLEQLNILVKARNFLVFQGDVEAIAEQCSKDLSNVIDQISGSCALKSEYEAARAAYQEAVEQSAGLVTRRKTLQLELRDARQHKEASDRYDVLKMDLHQHMVQKVLWRLYHIHETMEIHTDWIEAHAPRGEQARKRMHEKEQLVAEARHRLGVLQQQMLDKEDERKQLIRSFEAKRPEKDRLLERAEHARKKVKQARSLFQQAERDYHAQQEALTRLTADVDLVEKSAVQAKKDQEAALAASMLQLSENDLQTYYDLRTQSHTLAVEERSEAERLEREGREKQSALDVAKDRQGETNTKLERLAQQLVSLKEAATALARQEPEKVHRWEDAKSRLTALQTSKEQMGVREKELNDSLVTCYNKLLRMGQDQRLHQRESRLRETLRSLQMIFPGVHGRLRDLVTPTQKKYELAMAMTLGRHADAVVVHHEKTAMECIEDTVQLWDEQEMVGVQRERDRCMAELKELQQQKYALGDEDELVADVTRAQSAVQAVRHECAEVERRRDDVQRESDALQKQQATLAVRIQALQAQCAHLEEARAAIQRTIDAADDGLFASFCARIGVANVREYESNQLQLTQALDVATQQHQRQLARLAHQRAFSEDQLKSTADRLAYIQASMDRENERLPALEAQLTECDNVMAELRLSMDKAKASLSELREQHAQQSEELAEKRKALSALTRDVEAHEREVAERSDEMAQLDAERTDLYRRCRLEALDLPLEAGDLAQVPLEEDTTLVMETAQGLHAVRDYGVVVDFTRLSDAERTDRGSGKGRELQAKIDAARDEMEQLVPSTHMGEKLTALERDLKACEREMDVCRELVRDTRDEFQALRKRRTDLFLRAYHHIAERIDGVYKELTRSKAAPAGGVAYLTLDETDLSGGEKTMAALALLFAIHTFQPAPFFVLDEVDAALDSHNVAQLTQASLYERSQGLVGVYRNQETHSSASVTLDLESYA